MFKGMIKNSPHANGML